MSRSVAEVLQEAFNRRCKKLRELDRMDQWHEFQAKETEALRQGHPALAARHRYEANRCAAETARAKAEAEIRFIDAVIEEYGPCVYVSWSNGGPEIEGVRYKSEL